MSRRFLGTLGLALLALLAFPSAGHASIWDFIWSMSGPQMQGLVLHCELDWEGNAGKFGETKDQNGNVIKNARAWTLTECRFIDKRFVGYLAPRADRRTWLTLDTIGYVSTGKNSEDEGIQFDFSAWQNQMLAFEPLLEIRGPSFFGGDLVLHHGLIGATYNVLFGDFPTFDKLGFKFRPVGVTIKRRFNTAFQIRLYPNGFTEDEFGFGPPLPDQDRGAELTYGFNLGWVW
jgi:hypothetical protein